MNPRISTLMALVALGAGAAPAGAQAPNTDAMARWSAVTVVRYAVVGEFSQRIPVLRTDGGLMAQGQVTDRIEFTFDWNQSEMALAGSPTFRNFPSRVTPAPEPNCPAARLNGAYEHLEVKAVEPGPALLQVTATRTYPTGVVPHLSEEGPCSAWAEAAAATENSDLMLVIVPTIYLAMPSGSLGPNTSISPDGKSIVLVDEHNGWTWTYTPTPVR